MKNPFLKTTLKTRGLIWAFVLLLMLGLLVRTMIQGVHIETNILKLLPVTEQNPVAEAALESFAGHSGKRIVFLCGHTNPAVAMHTASNLTASLETSDAFSKVDFKVEEGTDRAFYELYFPHRYNLLDAETMADLNEAEGVKAFLREITRLLYSPMSSVVAPVLERDPLLLFPRFLQSLPSPPGQTELEDDSIRINTESNTFVLVTAYAANSPFSRTHQHAGMAAVREAIRQVPPEVTLLHSGVLFFAFKGTQSAEREISTIGTGSILGILLLMLITFRSLRQLALSLLPILTGFLCAFTVSFLIFDRLHLLTLGFGASLIGVCVDYTFHYFSELIGPDEQPTPAEILSRVLPGISLGLITSIMGYLGLMLGPFPGLRQMAVFSSVGLIGAFGTVVCWYPLLAGRRKLSHKPLLYRWAEAFMTQWSRPAFRRFSRIAFGLLVVLTGFGLTRLRPDDDVRLLQTPDPKLLAGEEQIQKLIGNIDLSRFLVVEGDSVEDILSREESLHPTLRQLQNDERIGYFQCVTQVIPSWKKQARSRATVKTLFEDHGPIIQRHFDKLGFREEIFERARTTAGEINPPLLDFDNWLTSPASAAFRHLWLDKVHGRFASIILLGDIRDEGALYEMEEQFDGVHYVNKVDDVTRLFQRYRILTGWLVTASYGIIGLFLAWRYGIRRLPAIFLPPCLAALLTLGLLGLFGQTITIFNVLALLLVLGIGIDYTLFFAEARSGRAHIMLAVLLSAITTILSFGLLALSETQALSQFGLTVMIGIGCAVVFSPAANNRGHTNESET